MKKKIISFFLAVFFLAVLSGCGCKTSAPTAYNAAIEIWGPLDDSFTYQEIFDAYHKINPGVKEITYRKFSQDTYKKELIDALAAGQGPDIFLIHNTWLPSFSDKVTPAPAEIFSEQKFRQDFVDVAAADFVNNGKIWAAPLSVDSLGLYYNKDLFNEAGIATPPADWNQFIADVQKLTKINNNREIIQSGAGLGTAYNINRATDVLTMLMLQSGASMTDENGNVTMGDSKIIGGNTFSPAKNALAFYTQFASASSPNYSWNSRSHYSVDAFSEGTLAMMFNYSWHMQTILDKSPKLNFAVAPVPQFAGSSPVNYANYWAFAVAKNKPASAVSDTIRVAEDWKLIKFLTAKPDGSFSGVKGGLGSSGVPADYDPAALYLTKVGAPAGRRDLIEKQKTDPKLGVFAAGNLIAKSWREKNPEAAESILLDMIDQVNRGALSVSDAIDTASKRMTQSVQ